MARAAVAEGAGAARRQGGPLLTNSDTLTLGDAFTDRARDLLDELDTLVSDLDAALGDQNVAPVAIADVELGISLIEVRTPPAPGAFIDHPASIYLPASDWIMSEGITSSGLPPLGQLVWWHDVEDPGKEEL